MRLMTSVWIFGIAALCTVMQARAADECLTCHAALGDRASSLFQRDIHRQKGVTCAGCHGGDASSAEMELAMSPSAGFTGKPAGDSISVMCARCHSDAQLMERRGSTRAVGQFALLQGSVHGIMATDGKGRIAQCTTCHGAHGIAAITDPRSPVHPRNIAATCSRCHSDAAYMRSYDPRLPVDQAEKYLTSAHGIRNAKGDAKVAQCVSCHGSHEILPTKDVRSAVYPTNLAGTCSHCHSDAAYMKEYGIPTDQYERYAKSVHGIALLERKDLGAPACNSCHGNHGATPPGISSISKVCGTCHALNSELFSASPHKKAFDDLGVPECESCHGNHDIGSAAVSLIGISPGGTCLRCHAPGTTGHAAAGRMRRLLDSLDGREAAAIALVEEAEQKGMEISEAKFRLREIRQARLESRTTVHAFDEGKLEGAAGKGLAVAVEVAGEGARAIDEYYFRRIGLGISTLLITIVAFSVYLYIRRMERDQRRTRAAEVPHSHGTTF